MAENPKKEGRIINRMPQITFRQYLDNRYGPNINQCFRFLEKCYKKLAKSENSITFLCKCRQHNIIPKFLRLKVPFENEKIRRILEKASKSMVRERIQYHRYEKQRIINDITYIESELNTNIIEQDFQYINRNVRFSYKKYF